MLNATQATNVAAAQQYYRSALAQGDYYLGEKVVSAWRGKAALMLGLPEGEAVTEAGFKAMLVGRHPTIGKKLVQRLRKDRRPGVDLTFSVPKSVSLAWAINQDERILKAFLDSVYETMQRDVEPLVCRRVRQGAKAASRDRKRTGNLIYSDFLHLTSRPVDGQVDPHLHVHAFVHNLTPDRGKFYAAELEEVMRQLPALQAKFEARLARRLKRDLGYEVIATRFLQSGRLKTGWEIAGVDRQVIEKFSTRTTQIEAYAEEHGIQDASAKGELGAKTRQKKEGDRPIEQLRSEWRKRLSAEQAAAFAVLHARARRESRELVASKAARDAEEKALATEAVRFAVEHHLYRNSTVERHSVVGAALEHGLTLSPEQVEEAIEAEEDIILAARDVRGDKRDYLTTKAVLEAERRLIAYARDGRGTRFPIARAEHTFKREWLNDQQKDAVRHVLASRDSVTAVTGGAGTGKSSLMEETAEAIRANGKAVFVFAPSTGAREVLQSKGFDTAQTVEHLIRNEKLHPKLQDQVIWIDEAGLLDVRSMNAVFAIAQAQNARVVLSGDTRQHTSPRRGEAMRLLESEAGLNTARIEAIQRQAGRYKQAVELISRGHEVVDERTGVTGMLAGFDLLDRLGKIRELSSDSRHEALAEEYLKVDRKGKSTLVVAPTHAEGRLATEEIRGRLRQERAIGDEETERRVMQLRSLNFSEAEKREAKSYQGAARQPHHAGDQSANDPSLELIVQFHQNTPGGYTKGERYRVQFTPQGLPFLSPLAAGGSKPIPFDHADRFEVYSRSSLAIAPGDKVRFTLGGTAADGKRRLSNGRLDEVAGFDSLGNLMLASGLKVSHDYGHLDLGYVVTSHASQGKDRDYAIAAIGTESLAAVNSRQFYVTASRGREDLLVLVESKKAVRRAIQDAGRQLSATELLAEQQTATRRAAINRARHQRSFMERVRDWWRANYPKQQSGANAKAGKPFHPSPAPGLIRS